MLEKTRISHYIKPKTLQKILDRSGMMLGTPLVLLDPEGNEIAECLNGAGPIPRDLQKEIFPIDVRGKIFGSLVGYETERFQGNKLRDVLTYVTEQITDLILNEIRLDSMSEELLHNYKVLNLFYNVSNALVNILNVRKVSNIILDRIVATIGITKASVLLLDSSRKTLQVVAHKGLSEDVVENKL